MLETLFDPGPQLHIAVRTLNNMYGCINVLWINQHAQSTQAHSGAMIIAIKDEQRQIRCSRRHSNSQ